MDKATLSHYGWIVILTLVLSVMLAFATPFGSYIAKGVDAVVQFFISFSVVDKEHKNDKDWDKYLNDTIPPEDLIPENRMIGIGKTKEEYVIAIFNEDYSEITIKKNGSDSDGLMKDFPMNKEISPMREYAPNATKVVIEEGVKSIGSNAFRQMAEVVTVDLPQGLQEIGTSAFNSCVKLKNIEFVSSLKKIGNYAFFKCEALGNINLPLDISHVGNAAFAGLISCEEITIDKRNAFYTSVNGILFKKDMSVVVQYPSGKKGMTYVVPTTVRTLMPYCFSMNEQLNEVILNDGLEIIDTNACSSSAITSLTIPDTVHTIGKQAFYATLINHEITISKNVTSIGAGAFGDSSTGFIVEDGNLNYKVVDGVLFTIDGKKLVSFPSKSNFVEYTVPEGTEVIEAFAFSHLYKLKKITLSNTVNQIGDNAFEYSTLSLRELTIPESVTILEPIMFLRSQITTIYGKQGSAAETYANANKIAFVAI